MGKAIANIIGKIIIDTAMQNLQEERQMMEGRSCRNILSITKFLNVVIIKNVKHITDTEAEAFLCLMNG